MKFHKNPVIVDTKEKFFSQRRTIHKNTKVLFTKTHHSNQKEFCNEKHYLNN